MIVTINSGPTSIHCFAAGCWSCAIPSTGKEISVGQHRPGGHAGTLHTRRYEATEQVFIMELSGYRLLMRFHDGSGASLSTFRERVLPLCL